MTVVGNSGHGRECLTLLVHPQRQRDQYLQLGGGQAGQPPTFLELGEDSDEYLVVPGSAPIGVVDGSPVALDLEDPV